MENLHVSFNSMIAASSSSRDTRMRLPIPLLVFPGTQNASVQWAYAQEKCWKLISRADTPLNDGAICSRISDHHRLLRPAPCQPSLSTVRLHATSSLPDADATLSAGEDKPVGRPSGNQSSRPSAHPIACHHLVDRNLTHSDSKAAHVSRPVMNAPVSILI